MKCTDCKDSMTCPVWRKLNGLLSYVVEHTDGAEEYAHALFYHCGFTIEEIEDELYECGYDECEVQEIIEAAIDDESV